MHARAHWLSKGTLEELAEKPHAVSLGREVSREMCAKADCGFYGCGACASFLAYLCDATNANVVRDDTEQSLASA